MIFSNKTERETSMSKLKPVFDWVESGLKSVWAFGKKNDTSLMTGGAIVLGWAAVYIFWKESREAEKAIQCEEMKRKDDESKPEKDLSVKEKALIYATYCWPSALMGLGSTALSLYSHKLSLDEIAKGYMLTKFYKGKSEESDKIVEKLKAEVKPKVAKDIEKQAVKDTIEYELDNGKPVEETGKGTTLFICDFGGIKFRSSIAEVTRGFYNFKETLKDRRDRLIKQKLGDAFYSASDSGPFPDMDLYSSMDVDDFFQFLGLKQKIDMGDLLEFRDYGYKDYLSINDVMFYDDYVDPETGTPSVCLLRLKRLLRPTYELIERDA